MVELNVLHKGRPKILVRYEELCPIKDDPLANL
jgi:hypothetical protein